MEEFSMRKSIIGICAAVLLAMAIWSPSTTAQEVAALTGVVTDKSGAAVVDAALKLVDTRTGVAYAAKSNSDGTYRFPKLPPGPGYILTVTKEGFETVSVSNLYIPVATTATRNVELQVGTVTQTVEVHAQGSVSLNTTDVTIGNNFDMRAVETLPIQLRDDPANLLRLQPGVVSADTNNDDFGKSREGSVAGARADQDNVTVDGIDATDFGTGGPFTTIATIPVDAVQEFRTEVANPLAENGRAGGAQTIITTKSGTNEWHGSAREYHRNTITEANTFFNNKSHTPRSALIRNQFGANLGGPALKNKLFFFFNYDGRRDGSQISITQFTFLDHVYQGKVAYINNKPGCGPFSTIQSNPNCVTLLDSPGVAALDPCSSATPPGPCTGVTPGFNPNLLALIKSRYPHSNLPSVGDGLNSGGLVFNAPSPLSENNYLARIDWVATSNHKVFTRFNFNNINTVNDNPSSGILPIWFPGDPLTAPALTRDLAWVIGHTWTINQNLVNQFVYGETRNGLDFPINFNPGGSVFFLNWFPFAPPSPPYGRQSTQNNLLPIPTFRDDLTSIHGKHSIQVGGVFRPIRTRSRLVNDFVFENLGPNIQSPGLDPSLRPSDILSDPNVDPNGIATLSWDAYFQSFLGVFSQVQSIVNYSRNGTVFPHSTGARRDYRYYQYEVYAQDGWKLRQDFTLTYGLRYQYDSVPYESNGYEATAPNTDLNSILAARIQAGLSGVSSFTSSPILTYTPAGKANQGAPGLYGAQSLNFSPRVSMAWNPSYRNGLLKSVLGDRKTVLRAGFSSIYDQPVLSAINFIQDQGSYLFSTNQSVVFGGATKAAFLASAPRFFNTNTPIFDPPAPPFQTSVIPGNVGTASNPILVGAANNLPNYLIDPHLRMPYSLAYSGGIQRELPGNFQLEVDYVGRFGRRLLSLADAAQIVDFTDPSSKHTLVGDTTTLEQLARQNTAASNVPALSFFENQSALVSGDRCGFFAGIFGFANCTQLLYAFNQTGLQQGNLGNLVQFFTSNGLLPPGVGLPAQFNENLYVSNKAWSAYNGLIATLRKRFSNGLQMDFNYTFSHSLDNSSIIANNVGNGVPNGLVALCDAIHLNACRGNSEFDVTHSIEANAIYDLPFGRSKRFAANSPRWADEIIGGWQIAGITTWRTGLAFPVVSGTHTASVGADALAIFNGNGSALGESIHTDTSQNNVIQFFADPTKALAAFSPVSGLQTGNRDILHGPHFSNWDLALVKSFPLFSEKYKLTFRTDAFNAFNHPNFSLPNTNINSPTFGQISSTSGNPRILQFALRFDF
jgi:Carboxypeptidase regulatory-like domain/TonB dependent receptor